MRLLTRTLLVVASTVILSTVILYLASRLTLLQGYETIEYSDTRANVLRVVNSYFDQSRSLNISDRAYAVWDDMVQFVEQPDQAFLDALGLTPELFATHRANLIAILDKNYQPAFLKMYDLQTQQPLDIPADLIALLQPGSPLLAHTSAQPEIGGVIVLDGKPMYVASLGALHTDFSGEPQGAVIFGRYLDDQVVADLTAASRLGVSAYLLDDPQLPADITEAQAMLSAAPDPAAVHVTSLDGDTVAGYTFIRSITGEPAFVLKVVLPRAIYGQGLTSFRYFAVLAALAGLGFVVVSVLLLQRFVLAPLTRLNREISAIRASGDDAQRVTVRGRDEIASLSLTINEMLAALEERSEERYRAVFNSVNDAIFVHDVTGRILDVNATACHMFGYAREELQQLEIAALSTGAAPFTQDDALSWLQKSKSEGPQLFEWLGKTKTGQLFWAEVNARFAVVGDAERYFVTVRDASERKQVEAEREQLIGDLELRNAELEQFTYTVSHDLKSPLITIRGFLGLLEQDALSGQNERMKADMQRIVEATQKMQRLLNELLELSRIGRMMNAPENIPFAAVVREAVAAVEGRLAAANVALEIAPDLPVVCGDRARLIEVVQNLLDNAAKFMGPQTAPHVAIGQRGTDQDGKPILFVADNGLGIAPAYHQKIFGLFDKLDPRSEGTGIGLALVKRIIEVHGGRIWVESTGEGQGAVFYFTLPQARGQ